MLYCERDRCILEIDQVGVRCQNGIAGAGSGEHNTVITSDENLVGVGGRTEPRESGVNFMCRVRLGQISGVGEEVSRGQRRKTFVVVVGVGDAHGSSGGLRGRVCQALDLLFCPRSVGSSGDGEDGRAAKLLPCGGNPGSFAPSRRA